jgi:diguanylate cyclase (GGDEF)-like protein
VVLSDIDHFKSVNDTYGHGTGDDVLKAVAQALGTTARLSDVVARYGGEEFCMVLEATDLAGAVRLAERMRLAVRALRFDTPKGPLTVTMSFGVSLCTEATVDIHDLLTRADTNLYKAKQAGRDRVVS